MDTNSPTGRNSKKLPDIDESVWNLKTITVFVVVIFCVFLLLFGVFKLKSSPATSLAQEFEGRIVEKWSSYSETQTGSYPYFRLVIDVNGTQFTVPVNKEIYQEAEVGLRLKRSAQGLEVIHGPMNSTTVR